ncbi:MAG: hypothetical protein ABIJ09_10130 [Pseudomonadota bacterium]
MASNAFRDALGAAALIALLTACPPPPDDKVEPLGDGFSSVLAIDSHTVILSLRRTLTRESVQVGAFTIADYTMIPPEPLTVQRAEASGDAEVTLVTATQVRGVTYTLRVNGLQDSDGFDISGTVNFVGAGAAELAQVTLVVDDTALAAAHGSLSARISVDDSGRFDADGHRDLGLDPGSWSTTVQIAADRNRTVDRGDDGDTAIDRRAYSVRLLDGEGQPASPLTLFAVPAAADLTVVIPLWPPRTRCPGAPVPDLEPPPAPVDSAPADGVAQIRIFVDDRQAQELRQPQLSVTADIAGVFSLDERVVDLSDADGDRVYEAVLGLAVDPQRTNTDIETAPLEELPYIAFLVQDGVKLSDFFIFVTAVDETPRSMAMPLGEAGKVPVTLRVDVGSAFLSADGSLRGRHADEAIFVTGNFVNIVDAFRQNCADTWSGGENMNLRMRERADLPGVWEKTLWMPPGRTQTFKVVRCPATSGCGGLNQRVTSTGNAFVTVAKNLATENRDASEAAEVTIVDPGHLSSVSVGGQILDYSSAEIYVGTGTGREDDPANTPNTSVLFKQELPNLVVNLLHTGDCPAQTPVYVIGTWRDVNLPMTPAQILATVDPGGTPFDLIPYDYDDGMIGAPPPLRVLP